MGIIQDLHELFGDSYNEYKRKVIQAQEQWNRDRDWIYKTEQQGNYSSEFTGDIQPRKLTSPDNFDSMDLATMQKSVDKMNPSTVNEAATAWANIGMTLTGTFAQFREEFARTINGQGRHSGWRGAAAKAAVDAVDNYSAESEHLAEAATLISLKLSEMKTGLEETRNLMPGVTVTITPAGKTLPTDGVMKVNDHNKDEATQEARRILNTVYGPVAGQTDTGVPYLPAAPQITSGPTPAASGPYKPSSPNARPNDATGPDRSSVPAASGPSASAASGPGSDHTREQCGASGPAQAASQQSSGTSGSTNPSATGSQSTATAGYDPTTSRYGSEAGPGISGYSGSGLRSAGVPAYSDARNAGGSTFSTPSRGFPGTSAAMQAAAQRAASTGRTGMPGMAGLGSAAPGKKTADPEKSGVPDYLVTREHGEELTGSDERPEHVPPVTGGDYDVPKY
ncbi:hypothetical protein [Nocardia vaccinii]|uniref:hypothetical protein n=1 Tax=Nocardia vaccinii TaxID=1822 RepID=UPI00082D9377|nr:hypothetical protein [Nocardia vaccinii]